MDAWAFRQLLRALGSGDRDPARKADRTPGSLEYPRSLMVICLAGDRRGLAVGPQFAAFAAGLGIVTRLVTAAGNDSAAALWSACAAERESDPQPRLIVGEVQPGESAQLTVVLVVVDRKQPDLGRTLSTAATLLAVGSGAATEEELARLAVAVDHGGRQFDGVVVADPDRSDRTTGRYSMGERSRQVPLPMRLTGGRSPETHDGRRNRS